MTEGFHMDVKVAGAHAPWQHGLAERHGGIFGEIFNKICYQFQFRSKKQVKMGLNCSCQAKNGTMVRNGVTPDMSVFGRALRWPEGLLKDDESPSLAALGEYGEAWLATQVRVAARIAAKAPLQLGVVSPKYLDDVRE